MSEDVSLQAKRQAADLFVKHHPEYVDDEANGHVMANTVAALNELTRNSLWHRELITALAQMEVAYNFLSIINSKANYKTKKVRVKSTRTKWNKQLTEEFQTEINNPSESDKIIAHGLGVKL